MIGIKELLTVAGDKTNVFVLTEEENMQLKNTLLEICSDVFSFCKKNDLVCMLGGGTALGAVRHGGFIPWDDDIDLNMPRKDYDIFAEKFSNIMKEKYEVFVADGKHEVLTTFMKVSRKNTILTDIFHSEKQGDIGIAIDIFPIENVPKNFIVRFIKGILTDAFLRMVVSTYYYQQGSEELKKIFSSNYKLRILYRIRCLLGWCLSFKKWTWWFEKFDQFVKCKVESDYYSIPTGRKHYFGEMYKKEVLFPVKECSFENIRVYQANNSNEYLRQLYGDNYMEIPTEEKREKHFYTKIQLLKIDD